MASAHQGQHKESAAVVLLNSDTIVTEGWLISMFETLISKKHLMIVGPLSNAATWQSLPMLDHTENTVPLGLGIDTIAKGIRHYAKRKNMSAVSITIINGFCFMFKREVLTHITGFDTKHFGPGYGEEVDFCLRTFKKGFDAQIVPNSYVFHTKTASFPSEEKKELNRKAHIVLDSQYSAILDEFKTQRLVSRSKLTQIAKHVGSLYDQFTQRLQDIQPSSILFVVPQSCSAKEFIRLLRVVFYLRSYNIQVRVEAIDWHTKEGTSITDLLSIHFPDLSLADRMAVIGVHTEDFAMSSMDTNTVLEPPAIPRALRLKADIVLAVSLDAVPAVLRICAVNEFSQPAFLLSDFPLLPLLSSSSATPLSLESLFLESPNKFQAVADVFKKENISLAMGSQTPFSVPFLAPNLRSYLSSPAAGGTGTGTEEVGGDKHKQVVFNVHFIPPHVAHDVYYASPHELKLKSTKHFSKGAKLNVLVHVDSSSAISQLADQTFIGLKLILDKFKHVTLTVLFLEEDDNSKHQEVISALVPDRVTFITANFSRPLSELADLYRSSDVFIDASSLYDGVREQLLLEVMACGCLVALPSTLHPLSFCKDSSHDKNKDMDKDDPLFPLEGGCFTLNLTDTEHIFNQMMFLIETSHARKKIVFRGIEKIHEFTQEEAALRFLEQTSLKTTMLLFGLDSAAFVSLFFAVIIVSVVVMGIIYVRPANNSRKK